MIVGSQEELTELETAVAKQTAISKTAQAGLRESGTTALRTTGVIATQGPTGESCTTLNSALRSREENDATLRRVHETMRMLGEITPQQKANLDSMLTAMSTDIKAVTEPVVQSCSAAFPGAKLPGPAGR